MNNRTILVVDDEPQIRRVLRATLSSNGYEVLEAKDGPEAIDMVLRERPDLILLDVNMPGMEDEIDPLKRLAHLGWWLRTHGWDVGVCDQANLHTDVESPQL